MNPKIRVNEVATELRPYSLHEKTRRLSHKTVAGILFQVSLYLLLADADRATHGLERTGKPDAFETAMFD